MLKAILFDMGGTLEDVIHKPEYSIPCGSLLLDYLRRHGIELETGPEELMQHLEQRNQDYRNWGIDNRREVTPYELWSGWYLKDMPINQNRLRAIADNLANLWERNFYKRTLRPEAPQLLAALHSMEITMGVISNTACMSQVIEILHEYGIHQYFKGCIYLSSLSGLRKPHPELFWAAAQDAKAKPEECIYVGDTISRDVRGARAAGYLASIRIDSHLTSGSDAKRVQNEKEEADYPIDTLLDIIPIAQELKQCPKGGEAS